MEEKVTNPVTTLKVSPKSRTPKGDRARSKSVIITGPSIKINNKVYGSSAMTTTYVSSMKLPDKEKVQEICAEAYMKLLSLCTSNNDNEENKG